MTFDDRHKNIIVSVLFIVILAATLVANATTAAPGPDIGTNVTINATSNTVTVGNDNMTSNITVTINTTNSSCPCTFNINASDASVRVNGTASNNTTANIGVGTNLTFTLNSTVAISSFYVNVNSTDNSSENASLTGFSITPDVAYSIAVSALPLSIDADNSTNSTITANVTDQFGNSVSNGTNVTFSSNTSSDILISTNNASESNITSNITTDGIATIVVRGTVLGAHNITATNNSVSGYAIVNMTDNYAPIITVVTPSGTNWVKNGTLLNGYLLLNATITDNISGVKNATVNVSEVNVTIGSNIALSNISNYWTNGSIMANSSNSGQVNMTIYAYDNNNTLNQSVNFSVWVDNDAPVNVSITNNNTDIGQPTLLNVSWTDAGVGLGNYTFATNNSGAWVNDSIATFGAQDWSNKTITLNSTPNVVVGWRVYVNDSLGNMNDTGIQTITTTDSVLPIITIITPANATWVKNGTVILMNATITDNGVVTSTTVNFSNFNASLPVAVSLSQAGNNWTNSTMVNTTNSGYYNITVTAYDNNATSNTNTSNVTIGVDNDAPVNVSITNNNTDIGQPTLLNVSWTDAGVGLGNYTFATNNSGAWVNDSVATFGAQDWSNKTITLNSTTNIVVGWRVYVNDSLGNRNDTGIQTITTTDSLPPTITITNPANATWVKNGSVILLNATIMDNGVVDYATVNFSDFNTSLPVAVNLTNISGIWTNSTMVSTTNSGYYNITVTAYDSNTTSNTNTTNVTIGVDNDAPVNVSITNNNTDIGQPTLLNVSWTDAGVGLGNYTFATNNSGAWVNDSIATFGSQDWSNKTITLNSTPNVVVGWRVYVNDSLGNMNDTGIQTITTTDSVLPIITIITPANATWVKNGTAILLNATITDNGVVNNATVNFSDFNASLPVAVNLSQAGNNWTNSTTVSTANSGYYNITVTAYDNNATSNTNTSNVTIGVDNDAPVNVSITNNNTNIGQPTLLNVSWTDAGVGLGNYTFATNNSGTWVNDSIATFGAQDWSNKTITLNSTTNIVVGWRVYVNDSLGNMNDTGIQTITTTDSLPPTITITNPANATWVKNGSVILLNATIMDNGVVDNATVNFSDFNASLPVAVNLTNISGIWTNSTMVSTTNSGYYNITVTAYDSNATSNTNTTNVTIGVDNDAPVNASIGRNNTNIGLSTLLYVSWTDTGAGLGNYTFSTNVSGPWTNNTTQTFSGTQNWSNLTITMPSTTNTVVGWRVYVNDSLGNMNDTGIQTITTTDTQQPIISIATPANATWVKNGSVILLNTTITDNGVVDNATVNFSDFNTSLPVAVNLTNTAGDYWANSTMVNTSNSGYYNITVTAYDNNATSNTNTTNVTIGVDNDAPVNVSIGNNNTNIGQSTLLNVSWTDTGVGLSNYTFATNNTGTWVNDSVATFSGTQNWSNNTITLNSTLGIVVGWRVYVNDSLGNMNDTGIQTITTIDSISPTAPTNLIHTDDAPAGYDNDNSIVISWTASVDASSITYNISRDGAFNDSTTSLTYTLTGETEGSHTYNVSANDSAGNNNATNATVTITVDYTAPVIYNTSLNDTSPTYGQQILVSVNVTDALTNITSVTAGSTSLTNQSGMLWNGTITAGYGANTITVTAYDNASNSATNTSLTYTGPAAPTTPASGSGGGGTSGAYSVSSNEPVANIDTSQYKYIQNVKQDIALDVSFDDANTPVTGVSFIPLIQPAREVEFRVQALKQRSVSVPENAPGDVYKYLNIMCGLRTSNELKNIELQFTIPNEWFSDNGISPSEIALYRWDNDRWNQLPTTQANKDAKGVHYTATTPGFSQFAISTKAGTDGAKEPISEAAEDKTIKTDKEAPLKEAGAKDDEKEEKKGLPGFGVLAAIGGIMAVAFMVRKREDE